MGPPCHSPTTFPDCSTWSRTSQWPHADAGNSSVNHHRFNLVHPKSLPVQNMLIYPSIHLSIYLHVYTQTHTYKSKCLHIFIYIYIHKHIHRYTHIIYIYIYIYTYPYTYRAKYCVYIYILCKFDLQTIIVPWLPFAALAGAFSASSGWLPDGLRNVTVTRR